MPLSWSCRYPTPRQLKTSWFHSTHERTAEWVSSSTCKLQDCAPYQKWKLLLLMCLLRHSRRAGIPSAVQPCISHTVPNCGLLVTFQVQVPAERVTAMAFSPDGQHLAVVTWAGSIFLCSRSCRRQLLPELPAVLGKADIQAAETCEERSKSRDSTALPNEVLPRSSASSARAGPDETTSRLAWIDHGTQGKVLRHYVPLLQAVWTSPSYPSSLPTCVRHLLRLA